jgi:tetratricopeptide (TPR) repeat protein
MKEFDPKIQKSIDQELDVAGYELIDFVPVPPEQDKMRRFRSLQGVLKEFDAADEDNHYQTYVLQVRKKQNTELTFNATPKFRAEVSHTPKGSRNRSANTPADSVYLANGKLNASYLIQNAETLLRAKDFLSAKQIYQALVHEGERMGETLQGLARCLEGEGNLEPALRKYEEAILYQPLLSSFQHYSDLLIQLNRYQEAAEVFERTLQSREISDANRLELLMKASEVWKKGGDSVKAEKNLRKAIELDPQNVAANLLLGESMLEKNNGESAKAYFNAALKVESAHSEALFGLGRAHLLLGDKERAHDLFLQSLEVNLFNAKAIFHLVKCAYEIKEYDQACVTLQNYIDASPFNANLLYSLAGLQFHLGKFETSIRTLKQIIQIQPQHAEAKNLLVLVESKVQ